VYRDTLPQGMIGDNPTEFSCYVMNLRSVVQLWIIHMAKPVIKAKAQELRVTGLSIHEIAQKLSQPKSTISYWCRDIELTYTQIEKITKRHKHESTARLLRAAEKKRFERLSRERGARHLGKSDIGSFSDRDLLLLGLGLYWGEGYKQGSRELGFTNSDPRMIQAFMKWMMVTYGVHKNDFICRVGINESHRDRVGDVMNFWSTQTGLPSSQFTKTSLMKTVVTKKYDNPEQHFGTLRIKVRRGAGLRERILGSIQHIADITSRRTLHNS
jgi:hypothetical protein